MKSINLFQLGQDYNVLLGKIEMNEGLLSEEDENELMILEGEVEEKLHRYKFMIDKSQNDVGFLKDEKKRYDAHIKSAENLQTRLKKYVLFALNSFGTDTKSGGKQLKYVDLNAYTKSMTRIVDEVGAIETENANYKELLTNIFNFVQKDVSIDLMESLNKEELVECRFVNASITINFSLDDALIIADKLKSFIKGNNSFYTVNCAIDKKMLMEKLEILRGIQEESVISNGEQIILNKFAQVKINKASDIVIMK